MPQSRTLKRKLTKAERWQRTRDVLEQFGLSRLHRNVSQTLSGGEKRRLEIARCLVCEPLLILLDEPFTGIDPITISEIQVIVLQLRDAGIGLLLTDHNVREALKITDRSYVITDGVVEAHGTPKEIVEHPIVIKRYLGESFAENDFTTRRSAPQLRPVQSEQGPSTAPACESAPHKASIMLHGRPTPVESKQPGAQHVRTVLEHERIRDLVEKLKTPDHAAAERDLLRIGRPALATLSEALERKDIDLRRMAFHVMQQILPGIGPFDPYAPEAQRRHQIERLRDVMFRKAG
jgi:lipopolysaccharide export system ATP-binding protein